jgi:hypothetical protein
LLELAADNTTPSNTLRFTDTDTGTTTNQQIGKIEFYSSDASTPGGSVKAYIGAFAQDTTPDAYLSFATDTTTGTPTERMRITATGLLQFNSGYGSVATAYGCRAWVNFNGEGTVAIRASGNVSSITDNGTGDYTVNFTTAMPDANYAITGIGQEDNSSVNRVVVGPVNGAQSTTSTRIKTINGGTGSTLNFLHVHVAVFR